jgi:hypothetical protein
MEIREVVLGTNANFYVSRLTPATAALVDLDTTFCGPRQFPE